MSAPDRSRSLMLAGYVLFVLALVTGLVIPALPNPRQGLSSHLTGLLNAMFLILLGLAWERLRLGARASAAAFGLALYGTYANWGFNLLASILGTGAMTPLVAGGRVGRAWQEGLVNTGYVTLGLAMLVCGLLAAWGLRRPAGEPVATPARQGRPDVLTT